MATPTLGTRAAVVFTTVKVSRNMDVSLNVELNVALLIDCCIGARANDSL